MEFLTLSQLTRTLSLRTAGHDTVIPDDGGPVVIRCAPPYDADLENVDIQQIRERLRHLPAVTVVLGDPRSVPAWLVDATDICLTETHNPPKPWVRAPLDAIAGMVRDTPLTALALIMLLRSSEFLDATSAVWAESATYSMLLGSEDFHAWLARRGLRSSARRSSAESVRISRPGHDLLIELNRPEARNAIDTNLRDALVEAFAIAEADQSIRKILFTGRGPSFCSGGDLNEFGSTTNPAMANAVRLHRHPGLAVHRVADRVEARLHGACVGAGIEIPAFASSVFAATDTTIRLPEFSMGLIPGAGGTVSITRRIGRQRTGWLVLSGEPLGSGEALAWGLIDAIID